LEGENPNFDSVIKLSRYSKAFEIIEMFNLTWAVEMGSRPVQKHFAKVVAPPTGLRPKKPRESTVPKSPPLNWFPRKGNWFKRKKAILDSDSDSIPLKIIYSQT
jgi:hypothetical protein